MGAVERFRYLRTHGVGMFCICVLFIRCVVLAFKVLAEVGEEKGRLDGNGNGFIDFGGFPLFARCTGVLGVGFGFDRPICLGFFVFNFYFFLT